MQQNENFKVYWEKQGKNRLCGLHCINSLLQGPYFDRTSLQDIALTLDSQEKQLLSDGGVIFDEQYNSSNHDVDGNYNIQVISEALKIFNVEINLQKRQNMEENLNKNINNIQAFIFNSSTHWFCLRKINNIWFNLNSTNPEPGPQIVSEFYLSAFIDDTYNYGFTNFIINTLPDITHDQPIANYKEQKLVDFSEIKKSKPNKINLGDTDDMEMEKAIAESLKNNTEVIKEENIFKEQNNFYNQDDDYDFIIQESLKDYLKELKSTIPPEPSKDKIESGEAIEVEIIYGKNKSLSRYFDNLVSMEVIGNYVKFTLGITEDIKFSNKENGDILLNKENISTFKSNDSNKVILYTL